MSNERPSDRHRPRWLSGIAGWLFVIAAVWTAIGFGTQTDREAEGQTDEKEPPFAQTARDDHDSPVWRLTFSPDDKRLASATISGLVRIKDLATGHSLQIQRGPMCSAQTLAFSPDGETLVVAGSGAPVRVFSAATGASREPIEPGFEATRVAFSRDGKCLATGGTGKTLSLWDWSRRRRLTDLKGLRTGIGSLAISPDGSTLATGDVAGLVMLWDLSASRVRTTILPHEHGSPVVAVAFSPAGELLATASYPRGFVRLWNPANGVALELRPTTTPGVTALAFSPDGAILALARDDGTATLWRVKDARELGTVSANKRGLLSVAFSGDGQMLATGGFDGCSRLWDVAQILTGPRRIAEENSSPLP